MVIFLDYFTKWVEAFAVPDQKAETVVRLLVEQVVCRHGIPEELLSDRGAVVRLRSCCQIEELTSSQV